MDRTDSRSRHGGVPRAWRLPKMALSSFPTIQAIASGAFDIQVQVTKLGIIPRQTRLTRNYPQFSDLYLSRKGFGRFRARPCVPAQMRDLWRFLRRAACR